MYWKILFSRWCDAFKVAQLGKDAPNPKVVDAKSGEH